MQHTAHSSGVPRKPTTVPTRSPIGSAPSSQRGGRPHHISPLPSHTTPPSSAAPHRPTAAAAAASSLIPVKRAAASTAPAAASARVKPSLLSPAQKANLQTPAFGFQTQQTYAPAADTQKAQSSGATGGGGASSSSSKKKKSAFHTQCRNDASSPVVAAGAERDSVAFRLCREALAEGCVQTYMHLFQLAHRDPVCVDALSHTYFRVPDDSLAWVQQQLSAVEVLRRQSEFAQVLTHCERLADYFEGVRDYAEAEWFYETGQRYMMESLDRALEQAARQSYAAFKERRGDLEAAAEMYETMYRQALALRDADGVRAASQSLVRVYQALGNALKHSDPEAAAAYYSKVRAAAERGENAVDECAAYSALGDVSEARGDFTRALAYQRSYRAVAQRGELRPQECHATLRVADLEERLGLKLEATATLQEALQLAKDLGEPRQLCNATMQLGEAYRSRGQGAEALQCFNESFAAAMETGEQELIDRVRIAIGFARGEHSLVHAYNGEGYLQLVCTDIRAQLAWMSAGTL